MVNPKPTSSFSQKGFSHFDPSETMQANNGDKRKRQTRFRQDERELLRVDWLLSEFGAANAIIDSLCNHLKVVNSNSAAEYEVVYEAIRRRKWSWTTLLNLLHHSPAIADVDDALDHVAWRRRNRYNHHRHGKCGFKGSDELGFKDEQKGDSGTEDCCLGDRKIAESEPRNSDSDNDNVANVEDDKDLNTTDDVKDKDDIPKVDINNVLKDSSEPEESEIAMANETCIMNSKDKGVDTNCQENQNLKRNLIPEAKTFVATEECDDMLVNMIQGLKVYDELIDEDEVSRFVSLVNDLRAEGKAGKLVGQTYIVFKRPMRGHGKEVIQLGFPIVDDPLSYTKTGAAHAKGPKVEPIPDLLQDFIARLVGTQILPSRPDACVIDIYNEGEYSQPHIYHPWYGRPISVMFLSECDMAFGKIRSSERRGDYRGSIKLSFAPGSLISMEGNSADLASHAINATKKQRILVTFTKSQPVKPASSPTSPPQPSSSPQHHTHSLVGLKNQWNMSQNGAMPVYIPTYFPNLVSECVMVYTNPSLVPRNGLVTWAVPRHPVSGTGVFLPNNSEHTKPVTHVDGDLEPEDKRKLQNQAQ